MKKHSFRVITLLLIFFMVPAVASTLKELNWIDLKPIITYDDPFEKLTADQLYYLKTVARTRQLQRNDQKISESMIRETQEAEAILIKDNIDINALLAKRMEIRQLKREKAESVVPDLDGKPVVMPGFVLPLEYSGEKVTEFLLVPWIGACIHTPPPPANQIVHVVVDEKRARNSKNLFEPVSVTGTMFTKSMKKNLYLIDGSSDISIAYTMQASEIEPYTDKRNNSMKM